MGKLRCRRGNLYSSLGVPLLLFFALILFAVPAENESAYQEEDASGSSSGCTIYENGCFVDIDETNGTGWQNSSQEEFIDVDEYLSEIAQIPEADDADLSERLPPAEFPQELERQPSESSNGLDETIQEKSPPLASISASEPVPAALPQEGLADSALGTGPGDIPASWAGDFVSVPFSIRGAGGAAFPAEITLSRSGQSRQFTIMRGMPFFEIPRGRYSVEIVPGKILSKSGKEEDFAPVRRISLHGVDISEGLELGLDSLNPNSLPFGKNARQAYAIDPSAISFDYGEAEIIAKGTELYKCAEWDFAAQECNGEWMKAMDLVPGEPYTIIFNSTDPAYAEYDPIYGAPSCSNYSSPCIADSDDLRSRDSLATPEPNQPNTVDSCADGASGTYMTDESVENITITDLNGSYFNAGDWVNVTAWVYCWDATSDNINFVYSNSSASPSWRVVGFTDPCPGPGFFETSVQFQLDNIPGYHAVRVINQYNGVTTATCGTGAYDDNDDVVFRVNGTYSAQAQDAIIAYRSNTGTNGLNSPKIRFWNASLNGSWGPAIELPSAGSPVRWAIAKWSPLAHKVAVITLSNDGNLDAYVCINDCDLPGNWFYSPNIGNVWATAAAQRRYDFDFETITGDLMVVYGVNDAATNHDLAYKVLPANATSFSGIPEQYIDDSGHATNVQYTWVRIARKPTASEEMIVTGFDSTDSDINSWVWNGTAWGSQIDISNAATATGGYEALAVAYSSNGSQGMSIGGDGTTGNANTRYWNGSAWSATITFDIDPGDINDLRWATLKADPASGALQAVCVDSGNDLGTAYWSGSAWTMTANIDAGLDLSTRRPADFAWNGTTSTGVLVWDTDGAGTTLSRRFCAPQCTGTTATISTYAGTGAWITSYANPKHSSQQVKILSARLNSNFDIGSFLYDGTAFSNYGDSAITADTTVTAFEAYSIAFNITDTTPPSITFTPPTPPNGSILYGDSVFINTSITDDMGVYVALLEWNGTNESMNFTSNSNWYLNKTGLSPGQTYTYKVWARDYAGNWNVSETRNITILTAGCVGSNQTFICGNRVEQSCTMNTDLYASGNCFTINSSNVVLDCNNHSIIGTGLGFGIGINNSVNVSIVNCHIMNFSVSLRIISTNYSLFQNNTLSESQYGLYMDPSYNNTIIENQMFNNSIDGLYLEDSHNNTLRNNSAYNNSRHGFYLSSSSNNSLIGNVAYNNSDMGFMIYFDSNINNLTGNTAYNNTNYGFMFYSSSGNLLSSGTAYNNWVGVYLFSVSSNNVISNVTSYGNGYRGFNVEGNSDNNTLSDISSHSNSQYGMEIYISNNTNISNAHFYNNSIRELLVSADDFAGPRNIYFSNLTIDNPNGNFENYTSLYITDAYGTEIMEEAYGIKWNPQPAALPANYNSFAQKFVNITPDGGDVSIDSVSWSWLDSELTGYNENYFELWKYNSSGWTMLNNSPDTTNNRLTLANLNPLSTYGILEETNCPVITSPGTYIQTQNFVGAPNNASPLSDYVCVKITASNVVYDCNGYNITDNGTSSSFTSYGILTTSVSNVTIRNCPGISNYTYGAYLYGTNDSFITNSTAFNSSYGFYMTYSVNNTLSDCIAYNISNNGFYVYLNSAGNVISGCTAYDSSTGFAVSYTSAGNYVENNTAYGNTYGYNVSFDSSTNRFYNNTARDNSLYGFEVFQASNSSFISNSVSNSSTDGFYIHESNHSTFISNVVNFSFSGFRLIDAHSNNLTLNIAYNNTNDGFLLSGSNNNTLSSNYVCFNQNIDMNNNAANNSGESNTCDSYLNWNENGHPGCTRMCTEIWHRFLGNVSGNLLLAPNNAEIFYSWIWNGQSGRVYALNGDASIQWINLTALGRNVSGGNSTNDFEELDFLLGYTLFTRDNINATYSSDGSNPRETATISIFKRDVPYIPVANSTYNSTFKTGIVWDASQGGPQFNTTLNQDVVFVSEINSSQPLAYTIMVPANLSTYKGASGVIDIWVELD